MYVFISYAHTDVEEVRSINRFIADRGYETWFDEEKLAPRESDYDERIRFAIEQCGMFIVCVSKNYYVGSGYVHLEHHRALKDSRFGPPGSIPSVCVRLERCPFPTLAATHAIIDWWRPDGRETLSRALAFARDLRRGPAIGFRDWLCRLNGRDPQQNLTAITGTPGADGRRTICFAGIPADFLDTRRVEWTQHYQGTPTRQQLSNDLRRDHAFAFFDEDERKCALSTWSQAALKTIEPRWDREDGPLIGEFGAMIIAELVQRVGRTALEALRSGESRYDIVVSNLEGRFVAVFWQAHPKRPADFRGEEHATAYRTAISSALGRVAPSVGRALSSLAIIDFFYELADSGEYRAECALTLPLIASEHVNSGESEEQDPPNSPWWRLLSREERCSLLATVATTDRPEEGRTTGQDANGHPDASPVPPVLLARVREVIGIHARKLKSAAPFLSAFVEHNLADESLDEISLVSARLLDAVGRGCSARPVLLAACPPELPVHKRAVWCVDVVPVEQSAARAFFAERQGYLVYVQKIAAQVKESTSCGDYGILSVLTCGMDPGGEPWMTTTILPLRRGSGVDGAVFADLLTEYEAGSLRS